MLHAKRRILSIVGVVVIALLAGAVLFVRANPDIFPFSLERTAVARVSLVSNLDQNLTLNAPALSRRLQEYGVFTDGAMVRAIGAQKQSVTSVVLVLDYETYTWDQDRTADKVVLSSATETVSNGELTLQLGVNREYASTLSQENLALYLSGRLHKMIFKLTHLDVPALEREIQSDETLNFYRDQAVKDANMLYLR